MNSILAALQKQDQENAKQGNPTRQFETFVQAARQFGPQVSLYIDRYLQHAENQDVVSAQAKKSYADALLQITIPD